jgi:hypothetical protein
MPSTVLQSIAMPQTQMLRSAKRTFATRRDGNTTLALTKGDLLRDLGDERTHGITPGAARCWEKKKEQPLIRCREAKISLPRGENFASRPAETSHVSTYFVIRPGARQSRAAEHDIKRKKAVYPPARLIETRRRLKRFARRPTFFPAANFYPAKAISTGCNLCPTNPKRQRGIFALGPSLALRVCGVPASRNALERPPKQYRPNVGHFDSKQAIWSRFTGGIGQSAAGV